MTIRWSRWSGIAGIAFVVLLLAGIFTTKLPGGSDSDRDLADFVNDEGNRTQLYVSYYLLAAAGIAFLWFLAGLRARLRAAEGEPAGLASVATASGGIFVGLLLLVGASAAAQASPITFGEEDAVGPQIAHVGWLGVWAFVSALIAAAVMICAVSVAALVGRAFAPWFGWLGLVCTLALLFGVFFLPGVALPIWALVASVLLITEKPAAVGAPPGRIPAARTTATTDTPAQSTR